MSTKNVYIHIPFCKSKCNYCSFVSYPTLELKEDYLKALISQVKAEYKGEALETLYFGGGTPSILSVNEFKNLIALFNFADNAEIIIEINPESIEETYLRGLKEVGINRISIGSQTFDDNILKTIARRHNSQQIKDVVELAKNIGFDNISLDLIYGLPKQDLAGFEYDLKTVIDLDVQHVSLYGLKIEKGCYFYENRPEQIPDLDMQADMYLKAIEVLTNAGFEHYEISNFAKMPDVILNSLTKGTAELCKASNPVCKAQDRIIERSCEQPCDPEINSGRRDAYSEASYRSKHNLNYWNNNTYYGFGCAASGYVNNLRYTNQIDLEEYIENPLKKSNEQELSQQEILEEAIFLGFRKIAGIHISEINRKFGIDFQKKYSRILQKYSDYFIKTKEGYALTIEGILISNEILSEFIAEIP